MATTRYSRITGIGGYVPERVMSNRELESVVDTSHEWIVSHTGIEQRHLAAHDQRSSDLAVPACHRAMADAGVDPGDVDLIVVATTTEDMIFPSTACLLQAKLGAHSAAAFDIQAVCTGFIYALAVADKFVVSGQNHCVLVVGTEVFSRILDWNDRTTCVLFGDGAGAAVLQSAQTPGLLSSHLYSDGRMSHVLRAPGGVSHGQVHGNPFMEMDGRAVFDVAVRSLTAAGEEALRDNGLTPGDVDWIVPHQANARILEDSAERLGIGRERLIMTLAHHANTSAASVPLAMSAAAREGHLTRCQNVLLLAVGGGMTWGSILLRL